MEPFGLFQFLRNALFPEPSAPVETAKNEEKALDISTSSPENESAISPPSNTNQNACLLFLDAHAERSKRVKKM